MPRFHDAPLRFLPAFGIASLFVFGSACPAAALEVAFQVSMPHPTTHLFEVEMRVTGAASAPITDVALPVWTPGSYVLREFARNVQDFAPTDAQNKPLTFRKTNKNTWRINTNGQAAWTLRYRVYANTLKVQEAELTDAFAFWNNAALLMHITGQLKNPATLSVAAPTGWKIATGLPSIPGQTNTFRASDFDTLYDSPFVVGPLSEAEFTVAGKPHRIVAVGTVGAKDAVRLVPAVQKIVAAEAAMMNGLPYDDYTFLYLVRTGNGGGLEHRNSTAIGAGPDAFYLQRPYENLLETTAHEYFHLRNVKRIKPDALGPFDYNTENYTRLLWVAEGITSYYEGIFFRRAGLRKPTDYLQSVAGDIVSLENTPGRREASLEEASLNAWIKYYKPDENTINSSINYYTKGGLVGLLLDLEIRQRTNGAKSLDDVMRTLFVDYAQKGRNYTPEDFQKVCEEIAGSSLDTLFARAVRGTDELDFDTAFAPFGLRLVRSTPGDEKEAFLGGGLIADPAGVRVSTVPSDTPAYAQGLSAGDIVLAVDNVRVTTPDDLRTRIAVHQPGDKIIVTVFRNDCLLTVPITLGSRAFPVYRITPVAKPTDAQRALLTGWLGAVPSAQ